eukprot:NODE_256_length_11672_cov_0.220168.p3 type:complete len:625 gc:universal NODE_256_length_11672_cov_0.220168:6794-8668(+)
MTIYKTISFVKFDWIKFKKVIITRITLPRCIKMDSILPMYKYDVKFNELITHQMNSIKIEILVHHPSTFWLIELVTGVKIHVQMTDLMQYIVVHDHKYAEEAIQMIYKRYLNYPNNQTMPIDLFYYSYPNYIRSLLRIIYYDLSIYLEFTGNQSSTMKSILLLLTHEFHYSLLDQCDSSVTNLFMNNWKRELTYLDTCTVNKTTFYIKIQSAWQSIKMRCAQMDVFQYNRYFIQNIPFSILLDYNQPRYQLFLNPLYDFTNISDEILIEFASLKGVYLIGIFNKINRNDLMGRIMMLIIIYQGYLESQQYDLRINHYEASQILFSPSFIENCLNYSKSDVNFVLNLMNLIKSWPNLNLKLIYENCPSNLDNVLEFDKMKLRNPILADIYYENDKLIRGDVQTTSIEISNACQSGLKILYGIYQNDGKVHNLLESVKLIDDSVYCQKYPNFIYYSILSWMMISLTSIIIQPLLFIWPLSGVVFVLNISAIFSNFLLVSAESYSNLVKCQNIKELVKQGLDDDLVKVWTLKRFLNGSLSIQKSTMLDILQNGNYKIGNFDISGGYTFKMLYDAGFKYSKVGVYHVFTDLYYSSFYVLSGKIHKFPFQIANHGYLPDIEKNRRLEIE